MRDLKSISRNFRVVAGLGAFAFLGAVILVSCKSQTIPTASNTPTFTPTITRTPTITLTPQFTSTLTNTATQSSTPTNTGTVTNSPTITLTPVLSYTITTTPTITDSPTITNTPTITPTVTATASPTVTPTPTNIPSGLLPGQVFFTGFITNGNAQQAFTAAVTLAAGTTIYLTNEAWDNTLTGLTTYSGETGNFVSSYTGGNSTSGTTYNPEYFLQYVTGGQIAPFTTVFSCQAKSGNLGAGQLQSGDVFTSLGPGAASGGTSFLLDSTNATGDKLFAFTAANVNSSGVVTGPVTFLAGIIWGPDSWMSGPIGAQNYYDSCLPQDLQGTGVTYATDLSQLFNADSGYFNTANTNQCAALACQGTSTNLTTLWGEVSPNTNWIGTVASRKNFGLPAGNATACPALGWTPSGAVTTYQLP